MSRSLAATALLPLLVACGQVMDDQPKIETYEAGSARPLPAGTIARGGPGRDVAQPATVDIRQLQRGRERFDIFCSPCHGRLGDGKGMIAQRGFPQPPNFHTARLRAVPDRHFYDVISHGYGVMYSYAARVPPADRWAIAAYIRALQLSQYATEKDVPVGVSLQQEPDE